jgi:hypothetical protein
MYLYARRVEQVFRTKQGDKVIKRPAYAREPIDHSCMTTQAEPNTINQKRINQPSKPLYPNNSAITQPLHA